MFFRILLNQARHKLGVTLLLFLAMTSLVTLYVYLRNTTSFSNRSMQLIMKNMGHNMLILPEEADPLNVYLCSENQTFFPDQVTHRLAANTSLASRYYVSVLQGRIEIAGKTFLLTGIEPVERTDETQEKGNMVKPLKPGQARLGASASTSLKCEAGGEIDIQGKTFQVSEVLPAKGTEDDYRIYLPLVECQAILDRKGEVNAILAFGCLSHGGTLAEIEEFQEQQLNEVQPGFKHISVMSLAEGRFLARETTQQSLYYLLGIVLVVTILIVAISGLQEVSERRHEVGILVAMGTRFSYIASLYLVKMILLALAASSIGFVAGSELAVGLTSSFLVVQTSSVRILWSHFPAVAGLACLVALCAMTLPMIQLFRMDPNETLIEE